MGSITRRRCALGVLAAALASVPIGCTNESGDATPTSGTGTMSLQSTTSAATSVAEVQSSESTTSEPTTVSLAPDPTGVPGLDDADEWCAAWAAYSGSLQVVGVAAAFGDISSADVAGLELLAAITIVDSIERIANHWPADVAAEYDAVLDDVVGPYQRRSDKAIAAMLAAGVTDDELVELRTAWLQALRARDPSQPVVVVPEVRPALMEKVRAAADQFDAAVTPFAADPSLVVDTIDTPATDARLAEQCPDLANSGVGDAV